ncbi:MAG: 50S ribosomal protein L29 [Candidatus Magasanikbacteria bacterium]|jgi:ribosomal protein L29|nr:50S ribosomal protein L29 [Candidatus Magasanikbacteria bacterium]
MMIKDLTQKTEKELTELLVQEQAHLRVLLFQASERQLAKVTLVKKTKKTIARILTVLRMKRVLHNA